MNGQVDNAGRALLTLEVRRTLESDPTGLTVGVDTAFDGELVIPRETIEGSGLQQSSAVKATLADGTEVVLETFDCYIGWFGVQRAVEVIANDGRLPLLGIGLLRQRRLLVDYRSGELSLD